MTKQEELLPFLSKEQFEILADSVAGTCYVVSHYFPEYKEEFGLTDEQVDLLDLHMAECMEADLEQFLCNQCGWWSYPGDVPHATDFGQVCDDCYEEEKEDED